MGLTMPTAEDVVLSSVEPDDAGVGAGANSTNLQLGGSLGVALIGSIAITTYRHHLARLANVPPAALHAARPSLYAASSHSGPAAWRRARPVLHRGRVRIQPGPAHGVAGRRQRLHRRSCRGSQHAIAAAAKPDRRARAPDDPGIELAPRQPETTRTHQPSVRASSHQSTSAEGGSSRQVGWTVRGHQPAPTHGSPERLADQRAGAGRIEVTGPAPGTWSVWLGTLGHTGVRAHLGPLDTSPHDSENMP